MLQQALAQTGVGDPKTAGRKGPGSGVAAAFSGAWERDAVNRQFAPGAVETNVLKARKRANKGKKDWLEQGQGPGPGLFPRILSARARIRKVVKSPR
jgi:hypothetical protein